MTRLYGWVEVGERVIDSVPHWHCKTCAVLATVRLSGPLAAVTIDAAVTPTRSYYGGWKSWPDAWFGATWS